MINRKHLAELGFVMRNMSTSKSLKRKIMEAKTNKNLNEKLYWQIVGIYDTRLLGLVFYRNDNNEWTNIN